MRMKRISELSFFKTHPYMKSNFDVTMMAIRSEWMEGRKRDLHLLNTLKRDGWQCIWAVHNSTKSSESHINRILMLTFVQITFKMSVINVQISASNLCIHRRSSYWDIFFASTRIVEWEFCLVSSTFRISLLDTHTKCSSSSTVFRSFLTLTRKWKVEVKLKY